MSRRTYRNTITDVVDVYPENLARRFDYLVEVDPSDQYCAPCAAKETSPSEDIAFDKGDEPEEVED